jgi:hypothetical protein
VPRCGGSKGAASNGPAPFPHTAYARRSASRAPWHALQTLCVIPGQVAFSLKVDVLVLQCAGGALFDLVSAAVYVRGPPRCAHGRHPVPQPARANGRQAALATTSIPATTLLKDSEGNVVDWELADGSQTQVRGRPRRRARWRCCSSWARDACLVTEQLDCVRFPVLVTVASVGDYAVLDASLEEEARPCCCPRLFPLLLNHVAGTTAGLLRWHAALRGRPAREAVRHCAQL